MKLITLLLFLSAFSLSAQEHDHSHARNEIGISPGAVYSPSHKSWGFGVHAHYYRTLGIHSPWALGGSLERVFTHGDHWTISAGAKYQILDNLSVAILPGITFLQHEDHESHGSHDPDHKTHKEHDSQAKFSVHFELVYDLIHYKQFHIGPALDYSWSKGDAHFMLGIHCAYAF